MTAERPALRAMAFAPAVVQARSSRLLDDPWYGPDT